ncbi:cytochrome c family protein [Sphingomonas naphthae]|uniref:Cytochrome c family protein n=1 Tax=Sphingomonas naphthae TaxID=1813468 RepID=A0ABY7THN5_9SPHN|nr:cytochrome c family protein [Sphingomonas naphthae]WCT72723.1 cytochrome c family protein [Sphingomonas naphthae]
MALAACSSPAPQVDDKLARAAKLSAYKGDAARGQTVFAACRTCHSLAPDVNLAGPSLFGVVDRPAGTVPGYHYSPANRASHVVWSEQRLFTYLRNPREELPGTFMSFGGINDPQARADVVAYLKTLK